MHELELKNISKNFGKKEALKDVNIKLTDGIYGLLGNNGAGKTTLIRIITNIMMPSKGEVFWNGENIHHIKEKFGEVVGYVPQEFSVHKSFSAVDFLNYMGALKGLSKNFLKRRVEEVLEFVNLTEVKEKKVVDFSGGMKRRIGIAQAILHDPKLLVLDEPTAGLDPSERLRFSNIISNMSGDKIVIFSTHIISDIEAITTKAIIVNEGIVSDAYFINDIINSLDVNIFELKMSWEEWESKKKFLNVIRVKRDTNSVIIRYAGTPEKNSISKSPNLEDYFILKKGWKSE